MIINLVERRKVFKSRHISKYLGFIERVNAWKSVNKNLKTLLAVGGWVGELERVVIEQISLGNLL